MDSNNKNNSSTSSIPHPTTTTTTTTSTAADPVQSWWESVSKARSRILSLSSILPSLPSSSSSSFSLSSLADSDRPALSFLSSPDAYSLLSSSLSSPSSGSGSDPLCQWLYETYLSSDPNLLSFLPLLSGTYLSRIHSSESSSAPSLSGFEAVLLAIYSSEVKYRAGKPVTVQIPHLSHPSLYHTPRNKLHKSQPQAPSVGVLSGPLEAQIAVKSTKRPVIVGVALDCYFKHISQMPAWSKVELCRFAGAWAGQDCAFQDKFNEYDDADYFLEERNMMVSSSESEDNLGITESKGVRIPLPWEILQPLLRIIGSCLLGPFNTQDAKDAASAAVRRLYARASHDLVPQAILATRSLIHLDKRTREAARAAAANTSSNANTPAKDVADDQNRESSPAEPPGQSPVPNSAKIFVGLIAVGFVVAILLFFIYFKRARKLQKKGSRKVEERKGRGGEQQHGTWFFDGLEDEENPVKSIEEKRGKGVDIKEEEKKLIFIDEEAERA